jgi:hypothetical protein
VHSFFWTPGGGLIEVLLCPAGIRKRATIAEFFMASLWKVSAVSRDCAYVEKCVVFLHALHLTGFLDLIGVLWDVDAKLAGFGSAGYPELSASNFYVDFRAHFSIVAIYRKSPANSDSRIIHKSLFRIAHA